MSNSFNDKIDIPQDIFNEFTPFYEEESSSFSHLIQRNTNKERFQECDSEMICGMSNNFSNTETNYTKYIQKKKKKIEHNKSIKNNSNKKSKHSIKNKTIKNNNNTTKKKNKKKYPTENLPRTIKIGLLNLILNYSNNRIKEIYNNNIGYGINLKKLLKINQEQIKDMNPNYNKLLLNKTIKEIFSVIISEKYTNYPKTHNINLINDLLNEKNEEKKIKFNLLFNKTFIECIRHLRGDEIISGLEGLEEEYIKYIKKEFISIDESEDGKKYKSDFLKVLHNYENIFNSKRKRN